MAEPDTPFPRHEEEPETVGEREPVDERQPVGEQEPAGERSRVGEGEPARERGSLGRRRGRFGRSERGAGAPRGGTRRRRGVGWRTRDASAAAVGAAGAGVILIARLVMTVATLIALLIALAIVLRDVDANASNTIVKGIHEGANFFAGAFTGLIKFNGHPKRAITVDWGIALVVYLILGALIANVIRNIGRGGVRFEQSHRPAL
jgi:hypothetical protein